MIRVTMRAALLAGALLLGVLLPGTAATAAEPPSPTTLTLTASTARLTAGGTVALSARLVDAQTGVPVPDATVVLSRRPAGAPTYTAVETLVTDAAGAARFVQTPGVTGDFTAAFAGDAAHATSTAGPVRVSVAPRLTAVLSARAARVGSSVTITGTVSPAHPGATVRVERYYGGAWHLVTTRTLSSTSTYRAVVAVPTSAGWKRYRVVRAADRDNLAAITALPALDAYRLHTYVVRKRGAVSVRMDRFAAAVAATYADQRGWLRGHDRFRRVSTGGDFTVVLSQARYLPTYHSICSVQYSCRVGRYVIINQDRWRWGSRYFPGPLEQYRQMVVNHETGHWLGHGHAYCGGKGQLAPVMQQQSKGMQGCKPNAWPLPREL